MPRVELIYDADCPNIARARNALLAAFAEAELRPAWTEWDRRSIDSPAYVRQYGSPTILVDGHDVDGVAPGSAADACRVYAYGGNGSTGAPPVKGILAALSADAPERSSSSGRGTGFGQSLIALPGVALSLLPAGVCPACWPVFAGILGALGLGFLLEGTSAVPITVAFLGIALFGLGFRATTRRGYGPLVLAAISVSMIVAFKFAYPIAAPMYVGLFGLVASSVWNGWPHPKPQDGACTACRS